MEKNASQGEIYNVIKATAYAFFAQEQVSAKLYSIPSGNVLDNAIFQKSDPARSFQCLVACATDVCFLSIQICLFLFSF